MGSLLHTSRHDTDLAYIGQLEADVLLVAIGRRPYTQGLNLEAVGLEVDSKGRIVVDDHFNTSVSSIKCVGDVTFGPMLAHKAEEEGTLSMTLLQEEGSSASISCPRRRSC